LDLLLMVVNLDPHHLQHGFVELPLTAWALRPDSVVHVTDLLSNERYHWRGSRNYVRLDPETRVAHILLVQLDGALPPEPSPAP
jgi:starch synthase (maltosyl-transferring)